MTSAAVKITSLSYQYKGQSEFALKDINFEIPQFSCTVLLGPNGAGKSTLMSLMSGLLSSNNQSLSFPAFDQKERFLSYGTQECALYDELSLSENLEFFARLISPHKNPSEEIESLAAELNFKEYLHKRVSQCSGGTKQRAHIAVALLYSFPLIVLDEPFNNIDPESRKLISEALRKRLKENKITVLISSHQFEAIEDLWTHLLFIKNGQLAEFIKKSNSDSQQKLQSIFFELKAMGEMK